MKYNAKAILLSHYIVGFLILTGHNPLKIIT